MTEPDWLSGPLAGDAKNGVTMNLMFWKKKAVTQSDAANSQENPGGNAGSPNPDDSKPAGLESTDAEAPVKAGLFTRIKSKFTALTLRFKKAPVSEKSAEEAPDKGRRSKEEAKDAEEAPEKPDLFAQLKPKLMGFVLSHQKLLIAVLLFLSLTAILFAAWDIIFPPLVRKPTPHSIAEQPAPPAPIHEPTTPQETLQETPQDAPPQTEAELLKMKSDEAQARVEALKKESLEAQKQAELLKKMSDEAQALAEAAKKKDEEARALAEAAKKKDEEARAKARKKEPAKPQLPGSSAPQTTTHARPYAVSGEISVGNKDPKATAMTLKEAIKAMNADSREYSDKPAQ